MGWLEWDGAEDLRSRSRWWLALLSSAGEDRGAWLMEAMVLRVSVKGKKPSMSSRMQQLHSLCCWDSPYFNAPAFMEVGAACSWL